MSRPKLNDPEFLSSIAERLLLINTQMAAVIKFSNDMDLIKEMTLMMSSITPVYGDIILFQRDAAAGVLSRTHAEQIQDTIRFCDNCDELLRN